MRTSSYCLPIITSLIFFTTAYSQKFPNLAATPPMGWNSWNRFACDSVNEKVIRETADAMVSSGMKAAGYQYVVIDDCWQIGRDSAGNIIVDPQKFPSGMKALAGYIHSRGLKFGIYTCAGKYTCAGRPASRGYEFQDARQYAAWEVDYLKEDWCNTSTQDAKESYVLMRDALFKAGRPVVFNLCEWGTNKPWEWADTVGHLWRTCGDINDSWDQAYAENGKIWSGGVLVNLRLEKGLEKYAGPGHWNDPDMLEVGNTGLTITEARSHFSLWCMAAAPLIAGNDLRTMPKTVQAILTEKEAIAIDQDGLGRQGTILLEDREWLAYVKPLSGGDTAVCFLNKSGRPAKLSFDWAAHHFAPGATLRDIWLHQPAGNTSTPLRAIVESHDVLFLRIQK